MALAPLGLPLLVALLLCVSAHGGVCLGVAAPEPAFVFRGMQRAALPPQAAGLAGVAGVTVATADGEHLYGVCKPPEPGHGAIVLLTGKGVLLALPWLAVVAYAARVIPTHYPVPLVVAELGIGLVALAALPALLVASARRLLVLLALIPGSAFAASLMTTAGVDFAAMPLPASQ